MCFRGIHSPGYWTLLVLIIFWILQLKTWSVYRFINKLFISVTLTALISYINYFLFWILPKSSNLLFSHDGQHSDLCSQTGCRTRVHRVLKPRINPRVYLWSWAALAGGILESGTSIGSLWLSFRYFSLKHEAFIVFINKLFILVIFIIHIFVFLLHSACNFTASPDLDQGRRRKREDLLELWIKRKCGLEQPIFGWYCTKCN